MIYITKVFAFICRYRTSNKSTLKLHIRSRHTGEKPYACKFDKCNYRTADHNSFRRHKLRHSGGHKYKCPYEQCNYTSIQSSTYKMHLKNKHPDVSNADGLVLKCSNCSFKKETFFVLLAYCVLCATNMNSWYLLTE